MHSSKWDPLRQLPAVFFWGPGFSRSWNVCSLPAPLISNNNLQPSFTLPLPSQQHLAIYAYSQGLETDWSVLELACCVRDGRGATLLTDFNVKVEIFLLSLYFKEGAGAIHVEREGL